jgi:hypothetical protein
MNHFTQYIGQILTLKFNSGEEIITKVVEAKLADNWIKVSDPVSIAPSPKGMTLVPSIFTADLDEPIHVNTNSISIYGITEEAVKFKYIEATTGLQLPPEKKLILG